MSVARFALRRTHGVIITALAMLLLGVLVWNKVAPSDPNAASKRTTDAPNPKASGFFGKPLPGALPLEAQLVDRLKAAWEARDSTYKPRT
jgi:hypothetical protein